MINTGDEDDGFGIPRNQLRHGTFSRFRMVVHIDSLDKALRSSRESLQEGELYNLAQDFLRAAFNFARNRLVEYEESQSPGAVKADGGRVSAWGVAPATVAGIFFPLSLPPDRTHREFRAQGFGRPRDQD